LTDSYILYLVSRHMPGGMGSVNHTWRFKFEGWGTALNAQSTHLAI